MKFYTNDYKLDFAVKRFINRYLPHLLFDGINIHHEIKRNIIDNDGKKARVTFYFFTRHNKIPEKLVTTKDWQNAYENFRFLRSNRNTNATKRTLQDVSNASNTDLEEITDATVQPIFKKKVIIRDIIGDYFTSSEARLLFNCRKDETAYDCLTRRIDKFDSILNNKDTIASIVNKATEANGQLNESQLMIMSQRILIMRTAYLFILESDTSKSISFEDCCKKSIKFHHKMSGFKLINNPRIFHLRRRCRWDWHESYP